MAHDFTLQLIAACGMRHAASLTRLGGLRVRLLGAGKSSSSGWTAKRRILRPDYNTYHEYFLLYRGSAMALTAVSLQVCRRAEHSAQPSPSAPVHARNVHRVASSGIPTALCSRHA
jgi:hypothetical protein